MPEDALIQSLNSGLTYIYTYYQWSWDIYEEVVDNFNGTSLQTTYGIKELLYIAVNDEELKYVEYDPLE